MLQVLQKIVHKIENSDRKISSPAFFGNNHNLIKMPVYFRVNDVSEIWVNFQTYNTIYVLVAASKGYMLRSKTGPIKIQKRANFFLMDTIFQLVYSFIIFALFEEGPHLPSPVSLYYVSESFTARPKGLS